jgi:hypothetical protein
MTKQKVAVRNYKYSDSFLKQKADLIAMCIERDATEFLSRKVTALTQQAFKTMISNFDNSPGDEIILGNISNATEEKEALAEALRVKIRTLRSMADNVWGKKHVNYRIYEFERISKSKGNQLHRLARKVINVASEQLADLAAEGLTQATIDDLKACDDSFDLAIDAKEEQTACRDTSSQDRIAKANIVFKEMQRLCKIGKDLFAASNESKYNDYVLYNTPSGSATSARKKTARKTAKRVDNKQANVTILPHQASEINIDREEVE